MLNPPQTDINNNDKGQATVLWQNQGSWKCGITPSMTAASRMDGQSGETNQNRHLQSLWQLEKPGGKAESICVQQPQYVFIIT